MLLVSQVERIILEAQASGEFDNLAGHGKPLDPAMLRAGNAVLPGAEALPEWLDQLRRIETQNELLDRFLAAYTQEYASEHAALAELQVVAGEARSRPWYRTSNRAAGHLVREFDRFNRRRTVSLARYAHLLHPLARMIERFNFIVPSETRQLTRPEVNAMLQEFAARFPPLEQRPDGSLCQVEGLVPPELLAAPAAFLPQVEPGPREPHRSLEDLQQLLAARRFRR